MQQVTTIIEKLYVLIISLNFQNLLVIQTWQKNYPFTTTNVSGKLSKLRVARPREEIFFKLGQNMLLSVDVMQVWMGLWSCEVTLFICKCVYTSVQV